MLMRLLVGIASDRVCLVGRRIENIFSFAAVEVVLKLIKGVIQTSVPRDFDLLLLRHLLASVMVLRD